MMKPGAVVCDGIVVTMLHLLSATLGANNRLVLKRYGSAWYVLALQKEPVSGGVGEISLLCAEKPKGNASTDGLTKH